MIKAVFFDLNDTLINHSQAQNIAIQKLAHLSFPKKQTEFILTWKKIAKKYWDLFEKNLISFEEQKLERIKITWQHFKKDITVPQIKKYADS